MDKTGNVILGNCINCNGIVRVPVTAPAKSKVRCPHCSESFGLAKILSEAIPELELVPDEPQASGLYIDRVPETKAPHEPREKFVVPLQLSEGARRRRRSSHSSRDKDSDSNAGRDSTVTSQQRGSDEASVADFEFGVEEDGRPSQSSEREYSSNRRSTSSSGRRSGGRRSSTQRYGDRNTVRERNGMVELIKVVAGGLLALPIAYLLVMWVFQQDPLGMGASLGNTIPFLVPESLKGELEPSLPLSGDDGFNAPAPGVSDEPEDAVRSRGLLSPPEVDPDSVKAK